MTDMKNVDADIKEVFKKLDIPNNSENQYFEVWEVTPLKKAQGFFLNLVNCEEYYAIII